MLSHRLQLQVHHQIRRDLLQITPHTLQFHRRRHQHTRSRLKQIAAAMDVIKAFAGVSPAYSAIGFTLALVALFVIYVRWFVKKS